MQAPSRVRVFNLNLAIVRLPPLHFTTKVRFQAWPSDSRGNRSWYNLAVNDQLERVGAARVDGDFFQTLQSAPEIGRVFDASDQKSGSNQVVVLSFGLWQQMFGGAENILGQTIRLDDKFYQVVGVMPREFGFPHK
jgi:hypothetical protein